MKNNIDYVKIGYCKGDKYTAPHDIYAIELTVDIKLGDTVYKDAVITIPEETIKHLFWKYGYKPNY